MKASVLSFQAAVSCLLAGMVWGIVMASSGDHSAMPAHAHLNLLGWVSLFLFGVFYRLHPVLETARLALAQVAIWVAGTIVLTIGVAMIHQGRSAGEPLAAIGAFTLVSGALLFGWLVFRGSRQVDAAQVRMAAASA